MSIGPPNGPIEEKSTELCVTILKTKVLLSALSMFGYSFRRYDPKNLNEH